MEGKGSLWEEATLQGEGVPDINREKGPCVGHLDDVEIIGQLPFVAHTTTTVCTAVSQSPKWARGQL